MTEPVFGITFNRDDTGEVRPAVGSDMSVIGIIGTASDDSPTVLPLNVAKVFSTSDPILIAALGATMGGTIGDAVSAIGAQLKNFQVSARVVIIRIEEGADDDETMANIIGTQAGFTGLWAFRKAGSALGVIPRIILAPGFTHQQKNGIKSPVITNAGSGGANGTFDLAFTGGTGSGAEGTFTVAGGAVTAVNITNGGSYTVAPTLSFAASSGLTGAAVTVSLGLSANPVCAALVPHLEALTAHAIVEGPGTTDEAIQNWRETLASDRLIPIDMWVRVMSGVSEVTRPGAPRVAGIAVRRDYEGRGVPSKSWANQAIQGIVGFARDVDFSLTDGASQGQVLLAANVGIGVRGELGVETAISSSGFVFIGTDNAGNNELWQFYHETRMRDYIHLMLLRTLRYYLGLYNMTRQAIESVLTTAKRALRDLAADHHILPDVKVGFEVDQNSPEKLRLGRFRFYFAAEEPAVLRRLDIDSRRNRDAIVKLMDELMTAGAREFV